MSIIVRFAVLFALVVGAVLVRPTCAYACSCVPPGAPAAERDRSDVVFSGKAVDVKTPNGPIASSADRVVATFAVSTVWKGQVTQQYTITTPGSSASCGITFEQGKEYVVYGRINEGVVSAILCSRTRLAADASEDLAALGAGQPPAAGQQSPAQLPATGGGAGAGDGQLLIAAFGLIAVLAGTVINGMSRRRRVKQER